MAKNLVIVESPAKAKTIGKYLGKNYTVKASLGHVKDLPKKNLSVDVENDFKPVYEVIEGKKKLIAELKTAAKAAVAPAKAGIGDKASARFAMAGTAAAAAGKAKTLPDTALPPAASQKCRVWTASYGGQKSIIIRSIVDQVVNFTVLDVNTGQETREAEAFIAAYAKNGKIAGEYSNQAQALDKAFELCPEG